MMQHKLLFLLCSIYLMCLVSAYRYEFVRKCIGDCSKEPCDQIKCSQGQYTQNCSGCCDRCANYIGEGEWCVQAGDMIVWQIGECAPGLVCDWKCTPLDDIKLE